MNRQTAIETKKRRHSGTSLVRNPLERAAVRSVDGTRSSAQSLNSNFHHDFSQIPARTAGSVNSQGQQSASCPVFPRRCPFGGACHTCPARVQAKLQVNRPDDKYEQEADQVAEQIMRSPESQTMQKPGTSEMSQIPGVNLQRRATQYVQSSPVPPIVHEVVQSPGHPLDTTTRAFFESRFGYDFSQVRVHTDPKAAESARAINAFAYTVGRDMVFEAGQDMFKTAPGQRLLAHELTHVVQQNAHSKREELPSVLPSDTISIPLEQEAGRTASSIATSTMVTHPVTRSGLTILRETRRQPGSLLPTSPLCDGRRVITTAFRDFVAAVPGLIARIPGLDPAEVVRLTALANRILRTEGTADIDNFNVVACTSINSPLSLPGEATYAYIDETNRELGLLASYEQQINAFRRNPSQAALLPILQVIAHEKRHVTLGSAAAVDPGNLRAGFDAPQAGRAAYRVEEILTVAEEIAVARRYTGATYSVPLAQQTHITRLWNTVKHWVTPSEAERLRGVIIEQLRRRYGFTDGCDSAITLGILKSMEQGRWHFCDRGTGRVAGTIPAGLNLCERDGRHRVCGSA